MNRDRRKKLQSAGKHLNNAYDIVEQVYYDESDALDNTPESLQSSSRYEAASEALDAISDLLDSIDEVRTGMQEVLHI